MIMERMAVLSTALAGALMVWWSIDAERSGLRARLLGEIPRRRSLWDACASRISQAVGGSVRIELLQRQAGLAQDAEAFRLAQAARVFVGGGLAIALALLASVPVKGALLLACWFSVGAYLLHDYLLSAAARRRRQTIARQVPLVAETTALAVAAGQSIETALRRSAVESDWALAGELDAALSRIDRGTRLAAALRDMANDLDVAPLTRFVESILIAVERGTPLAEVLRSQAADARIAEHEELMSLAGKKDVLMMVPVVFAVLPLVVAIAVFPGLSALGF